MSKYQTYQEGGELRFLENGQPIPTELVPESVKEQLTEIGQELQYDDTLNAPKTAKEKKAEAKAAAEAEKLAKEKEEADQPEGLEEKPGKVCVFGDGPGEHQRVVNGQTADLCGECFYNKTLGEIAGAIKGA